MSLELLGISHHSAPLELREPLALPESALPQALALLAAQPQVREGWILSTCNRVEVMVASNGARPNLFAFLAAATGQSRLPGPAHFYQLYERDAVRHLFRVAASLDSLVVGEPQILGQLKRAVATAQAAGTIGAELEAVAPHAFHAAKRVRTETAIADQPVSVSHAAVDLARQIFGDLGQNTVLLLGAGLMGTAAARYLLAQGATRLLVFNRTFDRARELARKFGGEAHPLSALADLGGQADVVIACTGAPQPLITRSQAALFLSRRHGRPMLFLDLAVPRDVEPSVHQLDNAFVYNVDDLDQVVSTNLQERRREAALGEKIIDEEVRSFIRHRQQQDLVPTLRALQDRAESVRAAEWERVRKRFVTLGPEQAEAVEAFSRSLMRKWLHQPMVQLKQAAGPAERRRLLGLAQRLFDLELPPPEPSSRPAGDALAAPPGKRRGTGA
ncbi:MAG: glutamyl-tRNA reductase [Terriglobales bacterium]